MLAQITSCSGNRHKAGGKRGVLPWPVWLSQLGIIQQSKRSQDRFPVRARAWVAGSVPGQGTYERQLIDISLSH